MYDHIFDSIYMTSLLTNHSFVGDHIFDPIYDLTFN